MNEWMDLLQHWLVTYAIHSTLLLGAAALIDWQVLKGRAHWQELLWKSVLVGAVVSSTLQVASGTSGVASLTLAKTPSAAVSPTTPFVNNETFSGAQTTKPASAVAQTKAGESSVPLRPHVEVGQGPWLGLWMLGVAVMLARLQVSAFRLRLLLRQATPFPANKLPAALPSWIRVSVCPGVSQPMASGLRQICVPSTLLGLPQNQIDAALAHEWAHLQRADGVWRWVCLVTRSVLFFQPLNLLASRAIASAAEQCSDELALKNGIQKTDLVDVLARFALATDNNSERTEVLSSPPAFASAMLGRPHEVVTRIENLVNGRLRAAPSLRKVVAATVGLSLAAALALPGVSMSDSRTSTVVEVESTHSGDDHGTLVDVKGMGDKRDKITIRHSAQGVRLTFKAQGPMAFDAAEQHLTNLDGYLDLTVVEDGVKKRVKVVGANEVHDYSYWVDGNKQDYHPEGAAWFAGQLPRLFRISGLNATARAQRIYDTAGLGALISEASMVKGDHTRQKYLAAVSGRSLTQDELSQLLNAATQMVSSDVEKRVLLTALARHQGGQLNWQEYFSASNAIHSDVEQRQALKAALAQASRQVGLADLYISATQTIASDVEQSLALQTALNHPTFTAQSVMPVLDAARSIESDIEYRVLMEKLLETQLVSLADAKVMLARLKLEVGSKRERLKLLENVGSRYGQASQRELELSGEQGQHRSQKK